jgi:hypothetical protein
MNKILIAKSGLAYAAKIGGGVIANVYDINSLDNGAIAVFTDKNELVTTTNVGTILNDKKGIYIAVGTGDVTKGSLLSNVGHRLGTNYDKKAYIAPVRMKKFIGYDGAVGALNFPTLVAGLEASIKITDTSSTAVTLGAPYSTEIKNYSYVTKTGDTDTIIINALVTAINADLNSLVVAAVIGTTPNLGISLVTKLDGQVFNIALDGILGSSTITKDGVSNSLAVVYGSGTYPQVLAIEDFCSTEKGNTNRIHQPALWYSQPSMAVSGVTYDLYTIQLTVQTVGVTNSLLSVRKNLTVAIPNGATAQAAFETIMAQVFGVAEEEESGS